MNASDIRIVFDPTLLEESEDLTDSSLRREGGLPYAEWGRSNQRD
jgi:hypothetical protein